MKVMPMRIFWALMVVFFTIENGKAQDIKIIRDFRTITEIGVKKDFYNYWTVLAESGLKLEKNATRIDEINLDVNLIYSSLNFLQLSAGYRLTADRNRHDIYECKHRYDIEAELKKKINRFVLTYRLRFQNIDDEYFQDEVKGDAKNILRNRIQANYNIKRCRITPFANSELFCQLTSSAPPVVSFRSVLGGSYAFDNHSNVRLYFRIDREMNAEFPYTYYFLGAGYMYKL
jgi:hypothetical protein